MINSSLYTPSKTFKYSQDVNINYEIVGVGPKKLLFLHGFGASLNSWDDIKDFFSKDEYQLYLIDLKGFGFSSKPSDEKYGLTDQAEIIYAFIKTLNLHDVCLVGHSYGGGVSLLTKLISINKNENTLISKLILLDCAAYLQDLPFFVQYLRIPLINHLLFVLPAKYRAEFTLNRLFFDESKVTEIIIERYASFFIGEGVRHSFVETACQIVPDNYETLVSQYSKIEIPTLIIWGRNDSALPLENGIQLNKDLPNSTINVIEECGHIPHEELPIKTYRLIERFLSVTR